MRIGAHKTRDGRKAIILTIHAPGAYPVVGYIERPQTVMPMAWRGDGLVSNYGETPDDLVPASNLHPVMAEALAPFMPKGVDP